ncbi:MAG TPA: nitrogen fixation protein FixH [Gammaproteobacteria bacterium]|nr:nitrogen fixation protein FixH [Gammaproteobacteria bacterium]
MQLPRISQDNKDALRNPWFLSLLGIIAVFLLVNATFIVFAVSSSPGLVADDYYEQGREYEMRGITRLAARNKLNWTTKLEIPAQIYADTPAMYRFSAVDSRGVSIMDADVKFIMYRPSDANADFVKPVQQIAPGLYQTRLSFPLPGIWDINLKVSRGDDVYYQTRRVAVQATNAN